MKKIKRSHSVRKNRATTKTRPTASELREKLSIIDDIEHSAHNSKPLDSKVVKALKRCKVGTLRELREGFLAAYDEGVDHAFVMLEPKPEVNPEWV